MSDLISRQGVIKAIDRFIPADPMENDYTQGISVGLAIATLCIERFSQENAESSQGLVKDLIHRQDAIKSMAKAIWHYPNELYTGLNSYEMCEALAKDGLMFLPSAEGCKCPCEYREPCDYCHYDAYRGHGCPAEEGLKDE